MNKKKLSVVMAGAMLASSVAPVLAAEVEKTEVSAANLGLLIRDLRTKLNSVKFEDETINGDAAGKSLYQIKVKTGTVVEVLDLDVDSTQQDFQDALKDLKAGQVVEVWTKKHVEKDGKYYAAEAKVPTYDADELKTLKNTLTGNNSVGTTAATGHYANILGDVTLSGTGTETKLSITYKDSLGDTSLNKKVIYLAVGSDEIDFTHYLNDVKKPTNLGSAIDAGDFYGFPKVGKVDTPVTEGDEKVQEIKITSGGNDYELSDLYDGLMLTVDGHNFFTAIKDAEKERSTKLTKVERELYGNVADTKITANNLSDMIGKVDGKYSFTVKVPAGNKLSDKYFTVTGTNETEVERLASWVLEGHAKVDILAGSNRYATAVTIAKEYSDLTDTNVSATTKKANIVLVNGNSLVDGLAASPLAAALSASEHADTKKAPILLTEADRLPAATKAYLKEVIGNIEIGELKDVTIHIVGGESVVSKGLERELRSLGFSVERYGGDNREETSLKVADEILKLQEAGQANTTLGDGVATNSRFVVGANGEADAMSIAAVASKHGYDDTHHIGNQTPIIVAKNGGLSEEAMYELRDTNVTIVGGEASVSKDVEESLRLEADSVARIAGANRQETNAKIIAEYYADAFANNVIVAKDGQRNKDELIDALAAANFASEVNAPIVLATNKLSDAQINALELNAKQADSLYQVGIGVDRDNVVKVIAQRLGLTN